MTDTAPTFASDIRLRFRESDRKAMLSAFDLWSFGDATSNSARIHAAIESGAMPCDARWPDKRVDLLRRWIASGTPA